MPVAPVDSRHRDELTTVAALVARDPAAFEYLYDRWSIAAYTLALGLLGDAALAEQVLEEVFLSVWRQPELELATSTLEGSRSTN